MIHSFKKLIKLQVSRFREDEDGRVSFFFYPQTFVIIETEVSFSVDVMMKKERP
jgi:hypothetical protein